MLTRKIKVGSLELGGGAPIVVQTMTNTPTHDVTRTLHQIQNCAKKGAELIRVAVPDLKSLEVFSEIVNASPVPIVADIHFNHRLAIMALRAGAKGVRINPGNIGGPAQVRAVAEAAGAAGAAIRVGVNSGSLDPEISFRFGKGEEAMVESALKEIRVIEETGFQNIKVSLKASNALATIAAARLWHERSDIPQHLGVTEAGDLVSGVAKSAVALGILLSEGIGDTVRVSLTAPPEDEVVAAYEILRALGLRKRGVEFISCPTCGRVEIDLVALLEDVKRRLSDLDVSLKIAVMGCAVNGPGEAKDADLGIAGGRGKGKLFVKGDLIASFPYQELAHNLEIWARNIAAEKLREK
ncbi:MAG: flavodoxin-dependent (E)-4-hydroxy-3-methylbut-2-enyl-diphosphate synthase [Deltaproteobacteria bacterium]|jgi:(E)-4-hydroxy-3-methylbut-2-enyl-diphosphate synthase|nr:flavodoxin-dependent (E)-4-hydroxy-3-methylbut-2-enyl-diphosphate synthase [Deltaproteobacteria bacterium]